MIPQVHRVEPEKAHEVLKSFKEQGYNVLVDFTAVDYSSAEKALRFEVIYQLMGLDMITGLENKPRVEVHCAVDAQPVLRSAASLWPAADWLEREVWDMFGIPFMDRPEIKRLLMYESFVGHPLRKDYPLAKRQPLIGPASGELPNSPSFNAARPTITGE